MSVGPDDNFTLQWNDYQDHLVSAFKSLRVDKDFVDLTLSCEGRKLTAHKMLMSACSPYFRAILKENPCPHPVIILRQTSYEDLVAIVQFVYNGEVSLHQSRVQSFIRTAKTLKIRGLCDDLDNDTPGKRRRSGARAQKAKRVKVETTNEDGTTTTEYHLEQGQDGNTETWEFDYNPDESGDDEINLTAGRTMRSGTPGSGTKLYPQRFRKIWLENPLFSSWLAEDPTNKENAKCKLCNKTLKAKIYDIKHHGNTMKHKKREAVANNDPIQMAIDQSLLGVKGEEQTPVQIEEGTTTTLIIQGEDESSLTVTTNEASLVTTAGEALE